MKTEKFFLTFNTEPADVNIYRHSDIQVCVSNVYETDTSRD